MGNIFAGSNTSDFATMGALASSLPPPPDAADQAVQAARIFERRKQLGLQGRMSTFLTTAQGDQAPAQPTATAQYGGKTFLGA